MKKITSLVAITLLLAGCSTAPAPKESANSDQITVDESLLTVEITLPKSFVEMSGKKMTQAEVDKTAKEGGYLGGALNKDGSVTYSMTKLKQNELIDASKQSFDEYVKDTLKDYPTVKAVTHNGDFSEIKIEVTKKDLTTGILGFGLSMSAYWHQLISGKEFACDVVVVDSKTGEELERTSFPMEN